MRKKVSHSEVIQYLIIIFRFIKDRLAYFLFLISAIIAFIFLNIKDDNRSFIKADFLNFFSTIGEIISVPFEIIEQEIASISRSFYSDELRYLKEENHKLKNQNFELQRTIHENKKLKELLNFKSDVKFKHVTSSIVKANLDLENRTFIVNVGAISNIKSGSIVTVNNKLVGKVVEVGQNYSLAQLIDHPNAKTPVLFNDSGEKGILGGSGFLGKFLKILYCSDLDHVINNELVITSGDGGVYPHGLIVGKVKKDGSNVNVAYELNFKELEYVTILIRETD